MANSKLKCCGCKGRYPRETMRKLPVGYFCSDDCAWLYANKKTETQKAKAERAELKERKLKARTKGEWLKLCQTLFNRYIRERDRNDPCISCQRYHEGQYHAGHYRTVGGNPELRFEELNCHKQCSVCNNHQSGRLVDYRINLIKKIGQENVEWLEGPHEPKHYTIDDIKALMAEYKQKLKDIQNEIHRY